MIPTETRYRAVVHYEHFLRSIRKVAKIYGVSRSSLHRWIAAKPSIRKQRPKKQVKKEIVDCIKACIKDNPCSTMKQVCEAIKRNCSGILPSSVNTVGRWVKDLGYTRKKVRSIIDYSPPKDITDSFCTAYGAVVDEEIICIDEAGFYIGSHGRYGYSRRGERIHIATSRTVRRSRFTLVMAVGCQGIVHYQIIDGSCKKADFVNFIRDLSQTDVSGKTLVMDNLRCHHSKETQLEMEKLGCRALYIPPYSPRFNAIKYVFSTLKRQYRQDCSEFIASLTTDSAEHFVNVLEGCLLTSGSFHPFYRRVRMSVQTYLEGGDFIGYD